MSPCFHTSPCNRCDLCHQPTNHRIGGMCPRCYQFVNARMRQFWRTCVIASLIVLFFCLLNHYAK